MEDSFIEPSALSFLFHHSLRELSDLLRAKTWQCLLQITTEAGGVGG